jgi:hypothetical protein
VKGLPLSSKKQKALQTERARHKKANRKNRNARGQSPASTKTNVTSETELDGGHLALAGYLYQILGVWGLKAQAQLGQAIGGQNAELLLALSRNGILRHESFGQDAEIIAKLLDDGFARVLVQFKYSTQPASHKIPPGELLTIAETLKISEEKLNKLHKLKTSYVLLTNREITTPSEKMLTAAKEGKAHSTLGSPSERKKERKILASLEVRLSSNLDWRASISKYARSFGILESEMKQVIHGLVGRLHEEAGAVGSTVLTRQDLDEQLCRCLKPRQLIGTAAIQILHHEYEDFKQRVYTADPLFDRYILEDLRKGLNKPIVLLYGEGGHGKSSLLCRFVEETLNNQKATVTRYVAAQVAALLPKNWLGDFVNTLRNYPSGATDTPEIALERLANAIPKEVPPILLIAVDGLDELHGGSAERQDNLLSIIQFVKKHHKQSQTTGTPPKVVLLVTCRHEDDLEDLARYAPCETLQSQEVLKIRVGELSSAELLSLIATKVSSGIADQIANAIQRSSQPRVQVDDTLTTVAETTNLSTEVSASILAALHNPFLWNLFTKLTDASQQTLILQGDRAALKPLCEQYLARFNRKTRNRNASLQNQDISKMLIKVARHTAPIPNSPSKRKPDWVNPICEDDEFAPPQATRLFQEAISFGLISLSSTDQWRWKFSFIADHLRTQPI